MFTGSMSVAKGTRASSQAPDRGGPVPDADEIETAHREVPEDLECRQRSRCTGRPAHPEGRVKPPPEEMLGEPP
jgi:hypothetical protein